MVPQIYLQSSTDIRLHFPGSDGGMEAPAMILLINIDQPFLTPRGLVLWSWWRALDR